MSMFSPKKASVQGVILVYIFHQLDYSLTTCRDAEINFRDAGNRPQPDAMQYVWENFTYGVA